MSDYKKSDPPKARSEFIVLKWRRSNLQAYHLPLNELKDLEERIENAIRDAARHGTTWKTDCQE